MSKYLLLISSSYFDMQLNTDIRVYIYRGKIILKCSLVLWTSTPKSLLVLLQNNDGHSRKYNLALYYFYLSVGNWMKIYACPDFHLSWAPGQVIFYP